MINMKYETLGHEEAKSLIKIEVELFKVELINILQF